jgi:hypothetical protein
VTTESAWVPEACTLPTVDRPLRAGEFDDLFATTLRGVHRPAPTLLRLYVDRAAEHTTRDLLARESECCSFFTFTYTSAEQFVVDVEVPESQVAVLDALAARAQAAAPQPSAS